MRREWGGSSAGPRAIVPALATAALRLGAMVLLLSLLRTSLHDVSQAWDSLYYHVPFAARFSGMVGPDEYAFSIDNEERFAGYATLAERLQGILYRLLGRPEGANLLCFAAVPALAGYLRVRHRVSASVAVFALLALPLVQTHATSAYIDLPANTCATIFLLESFTLAFGKERSRVTIRALLWALVPGVLTAHMRFQLAPTVFLGIVMLAYAAWKSSKPRMNLGFLAIGSAAVYGKWIANLVRFGNPVYPVELSVLGHPLPFHETRYVSSPDYLEHAYQPTRFFHSILELGLPPLGTPSRWTVDQYAPSGTAAARMGGTFAPYLGAMFVLLVVFAWKKRGIARRLLVLLAVLTLVVAPSPQSHELRYYMVWPLVLVTGTLVAWQASAGGRGRQVAQGRIRIAGFFVPCAAVMSFVIVATTTSGEWIVPTGSTTQELVAKKVDPAILLGIRDGESVCLWKPPYTFLYAAKFHGRRYRLVEGEAPAGCGTARRIE